MIALCHFDICLPEDRLAICCPWTQSNILHIASRGSSRELHHRWGQCSVANALVKVQACSAKAWMSKLVTLLNQGSTWRIQLRLLLCSKILQNPREKLAACTCSSGSLTLHQAAIKDIVSSYSSVQPNTYRAVAGEPTIPIHGVF